MRTEFGVPRTPDCSCETCRLNCRVMPGMLIPADLDRMIPQGAYPFRWAETHLLCSLGAVVEKDGQIFRIPTLVPATQDDGSCIYLSSGGLCQIHEVAPFGCAFFDCGDDRRDEVLMAGLKQVLDAHQKGLLYHQLWVHCAYKGRFAQSPEKLRAEIRRRLVHGKKAKA